MLTAAEKKFWQADQQSLEQISQEFADLVIENGLPGSGHTSPDSPIFEFIKDYISDEQKTAIQAVLDAAKIDSQSVNTPSTVTELNTQAVQDQSQAQQQESTKSEKQNQPSLDVDYRWLFALLVLLIIIGVARGTRAPAQNKKENKKG